MSSAPRAPARDGPGVDVAIVGAGAAGLAAAARLAERGHTCLILEAASLIGGRARTLRPAFLDGEWIDAGAAWLHTADRNPLVDRARAAGVPLAPAFDDQTIRRFVDGREADAAETDAHDAAEARWHATVSAHLADARDPSLAEAAGALRISDPWVPTIEHWEAAIIAAADPERLSLADWHANELPGGDLIARDGCGALLARLLAPPEDVLRLETPVDAIDRRPATHVALHTPHGTVRARAAIVTVSTGVLASGAIRFDPPLPDETLHAVAHLPMGLLSRIVLRLAADAPADPALLDAILLPRLDRPGQMRANIGTRPRGTDQIVAFIGGPAAWTLAPDPRAAERFARDEFARMLGHDAARRGLRPGAWLSDWGTDPHQLGAYSYALPGAFPARAALARPIDDARLVFAGEACLSDGRAGTVGGAIADGVRAADQVADAL